MDEEEQRILNLFLNKDETAIAEAAKRYGAYCRSISYNILGDKRDAEECVNDTWLKTWNAIPPGRPRRLSFFIGRIARNLAFDRFKAKKTQKRGGEAQTVLLELDACLPAAESVEDSLLERELARAINAFLRTLPMSERHLFIARYWHGEPLAQIAKRFGMRENRVKAALFRTRSRLKIHLEQEENPDERKRYNER
ncbi:RNA polymerase sigma factor [Saccharibacillus sp. CPCC 101409]|uniref:RNA polymerase sigma factor n=1 Tax=Saccharibacillus sp. CPCC 101409 TaxID=3058041 RepID=UPI002671280F|nr:RNA polymerase sigma factor [Saccharibacillus sp. CPCC 101409]MDO3411394.1 RNA polymerase sigma factor [Saccharibacillus sp. CPCC 101409]